MFPCFYKYCVKFDMNRSPNTNFEIEQKIINYSCYFRKYIMTVVEIVVLGMYYKETEINQWKRGESSTKEIGCEIVFMVFMLIMLNKLSLKIYKVLELGWRDMQFKLEGIRQTKCMLTIVGEIEEDEEIKKGEEKKKREWYDLWPIVPPLKWYWLVTHPNPLDEIMASEDKYSARYVRHMKIEHSKPYKQQY